MQRWVSYLICLSDRLSEFYGYQKPDLVALEAQIAHGTRKVNNALKAKEESAKTEENLAQKVGNYEKELASVKRAADEAQGMIISYR
jgi:hypothetical protein